MIVLLDARTAVHLARAIEGYRRRLRDDGVLALPEGLSQLLAATVSVRSSQEQSFLAEDEDGLEDASMAQLLTLGEVADRLKVSESTVRRYTSDGRLPTVHLGRSVRVRPADLGAFVDSLQCSEPAAS
ncbi:MAG: helix-turn-helix domain-containing protein [Actinomycetota bacterium]|nr:helix-turn-helix domain-containing protein [Actinomycetota bacterium]